MICDPLIASPLLLKGLAIIAVRRHCVVVAFSGIEILATRHLELGQPPHLICTATLYSLKLGIVNIAARYWSLIYALHQ
jgi:hypothetical protein